MAGKVKNNIQGYTFNNWVVGNYLGKSIYKCTCNICGNSKEINSYYLLNNKIPKCDCQSNETTNKLIDLKGKQFGDWTVLEYAGNKKWLCRCSCSTPENPVERIVAGQDLRNGKSTGCGHRNSNALIDLTGDIIGDWTVIDYAGNGFWNCICSCGTIKQVNGSALRNRKSLSCGHDTTKFKDLTGQKYGNWVVIQKAELQTSPGDTMWTCECQCNRHTIRDLGGYVLRNGISKSCGCLTEQLKSKAIMEKFGVKHPSQIGTKRNEYQLKAIESRENLLDVINEHFNRKPTTVELSNILGIDRASTMIFIHKYNLEDYIDIGAQNTSSPEREIRELFPDATFGNRKILSGLELDVYIPKAKLAIEFNENYWHSELKKDEDYHQKKTIACAKQGIQLIHIFEYEWDDISTQKKILNLIKSKYNPKLNKAIHARKCKVVEVNSNDAREFCEKYHLQGWAVSSINIGLTYNNELVSLMTFGKPRFDSTAELELVRLVTEPFTIISGGAEKMFSYFVKKYNPSSIVTYSDISKFKGNVYNRIGFKTIEVTRPNYKWVGYDTHKVLTRYQTTKQKLIEAGLGDETETEAEIMHRLGYYRIYDCGNIKFIWENKNFEDKEVN